MSLFDRDSSVESSSASSSASNGDDGPSLPLRAPPVSSPRTATSAAAAAGSAPLSALEQRRCMAEADAAGRRLGHARAPWHRELVRRPAPTEASKSAVSDGGASAASSGSGEQSKFGASIAAAMQLRRDEKEKTLVQRLQQQRAAEAQGTDGAALAEKDVEVGVFVTASYRAVLQRNVHPSQTTESQQRQAGQQAAASSVVENATEGEKAEDDDDPLAAYLRQLDAEKRDTRATAEQTEGLPSSSAMTGDYYDRIMKVPMQEKEKRAAVVGEVPNTEGLAGAASASTTAATSFQPPSLSELQDLIGAQDLPGPAAAPAPGFVSSFPPALPQQQTLTPVAARQTTTEEEEAHSAVLAHARLVYDAREARRLRSANDATVLALAQRCDARIAAAVLRTF